MVPRPGRTTPEDKVVIKQEAEAGAPSLGRSWVASELEERPVASWSSEGTFTTGHGASDEREGYEEQFAVPDVAPHGAATDFDESQSPPGLKPAKVEGQPSTPGLNPRGASRRRRSWQERGTRIHREGVEYALSRTELFKKLKQNSILAILKPKMIGELTGHFMKPSSRSSRVNVWRSRRCSRCFESQVSGWAHSRGASIRLRFGIMEGRNPHPPRSSHRASRNNQAEPISTATAGTSLARVCLSAFSELMEFNRRDASD
ncbi:Eukaryotic/viral aspartic protease [Phytophthora megakarya]|uniref:Eukaryotic/viral aspartic protease n=1 Tax=Phytophthora megakarya TaxID=4795 RepID=A0A225WWR2_9STRA|nr:Eukaryotic/viral aspartic protease [Phytophthora megakarya]